MSEVADLSVAEDSEVGSLLKLIGRPPKAYTINELINAGPLKRNAIYREIRDGRLVAARLAERRSCWRLIGTPTYAPCRG